MTVDFEEQCRYEMTKTAGRAAGNKSAATVGYLWPAESVGKKAKVER